MYSLDCEETFSCCLSMDGRYAFCRAELITMPGEVPRVMRLLTLKVLVATIDALEHFETG